MISFRGGNAGPGWEKARRRRHSLGGGTVRDSCVRVVSVDARPAGYVSLEPWHPPPSPPSSVHSEHRRNGRPAACSGGTENHPVASKPRTCER